MTEENIEQAQVEGERVEVDDRFDSPIDVDAMVQGVTESEIRDAVLEYRAVMQDNDLDRAALFADTVDKIQSGAIRSRYGAALARCFRDGEPVGPDDLPLVPA